MLDLLLVNVPVSYQSVPPLALAVLKGAVVSNGFCCRTLDLGPRLGQHLDPVTRDTFQLYCINPTEMQSEMYAPMLEETVAHWVTEILAYDARWVGFSVFSWFSHYLTYRLLERIRSVAPHRKIVIGGAGCSTQIRPFMHQCLVVSAGEKIMWYGDVMKKRGLVDHVIMGDGESALIDLLGGHDPGIDFNELTYRDKKWGYSDFDDFDLDTYRGQLDDGRLQLPIFTSKGCVRNCDFCDVASVQGRFRFRSGKNVLDEMLYLAARYGHRDFLLMDSLANGSISNLRSWIEPLAVYNETNPDRRITWNSHGWICRPIGQMPLDLYPLLAKSGLQAVGIGIESGSDSVLAAMNKKTNVEAAYFELAQFVIHDIKWLSLMLIGHWSETWNDFVDSCVLMMNMAPYARSGHLVAVNPGTGFSLDQDSPAGQDPNSLGIRTISNRIWHCATNPALTSKERYFRVLLFLRLLDNLAMPTMQKNYLRVVLGEVEQDMELIQQFDKDTANYDAASTAQHHYENYDQFVRTVCERNSRYEPGIDLHLALEVTTVDHTTADITVGVNDRVLWQQRCHAGMVDIKLRIDLEPDSQNTLFINFCNKRPEHTIVDEQGRIIADKAAILHKFDVSGMDLLQDPDFFYQTLTYLVKGVESKVTHGFWSDHSTLCMEFVEPFVFWYGRHTRRNIDFKADIHGATSSAKFVEPDGRNDSDRMFDPKLAEQIAKKLAIL